MKNGWWIRYNRNYYLGWFNKSNLSTCMLQVTVYSLFSFICMFYTPVYTEQKVSRSRSRSQSELINFVPCKHSIWMAIWMILIQILQGCHWSGKSQGVLELAREIWNFVESQGTLRKVREIFRKFIFHKRLRWSISTSKILRLVPSLQFFAKICYLKNIQACT